MIIFNTTRLGPIADSVGITDHRSGTENEKSKYLMIQYNMLAVKYIRKKQFSKAKLYKKNLEELEQKYPYRLIESVLHMDEGQLSNEEYEDGEDYRKLSSFEFVVKTIQKVKKKKKVVLDDFG